MIMIPFLLSFLIVLIYAAARDIDKALARQAKLLEEIRDQLKAHDHQP